MKTLLTPIIVALLAILAPFSGAGAADKTVYDMAGSNPGGGERGYHGTVTLETQGQLVKVTWTLADGSEVSGTGIITGDTMAVGYPSGRSYGVGIYRRDPVTEIVDGYWTLSGSTTFGTERWTPQR